MNGIWNKILLSLLSIFLVLPFFHAAAQQDGLLDGKTMIRSSEVGSMVNSSTHREATDNGVNSYTQLYPYGSSWGYKLWYKFSSPVSISSYYLHSDIGLNLVLYDGEKNELYSKSMSPQRVKEGFTKVDNVHYVAVVNTYNTVPHITEFDVFDTLVTDPPPGGGDLDPKDPPSNSNAVTEGLMPWSGNMPDIPYSPDINDIFKNFYVNWTTLSPFLYVLYGILAGFFFLKIIKKLNGGD